MNAKTPVEIEAMLDKVLEMKNFDGMTYKEGLQTALEWALGMIDDDITD